MLSKTSIVILGLLSNKQLSAYEMLKKIEMQNMKYWLPIGNTTLYETALRLEKKGYIAGENVNNAKVIYSLTQEGELELKNTIRTLFLQVDYDTIWFTLATLYCNVLGQEELMDLIAKRKLLLEEYYHGTNEQYERMLAYHIPFQGICSVKRMLQVIVLEQESLEELEKNIIHRVTD